MPPQQEKALEELGIPLPNPEKPKGRNNNRKQTFDAVCRTILFDIARRHGLHLDQEPSYGGREYLEKQDYILMKQKEQLAAQEQKLEELTLKIEDVETLLDDASDAAYDKAVEVVADTVRQETHKEDIRLIEETKKWVLSPERKAPKKERILQNRTVLVIQDGEKTAIQKRPEKGLLAGLYELPNLLGHLTREEVLDKVKNMQLEPLYIEKLPDAKHIFSHIEWRMTGYLIRVAALDTDRGLPFIFAEKKQSEKQYAIPSAFRAYVKYMKEESGKRNC